MSQPDTSARLKGKVALVTGAAGGIGEAVVRALGKRGARIAALDKNSGQLGAVAGLLKREGLEVAAFESDVCSSASVELVVHQIEQELGPIDFLVNAAGVLLPAAAMSMSIDEWDVTFSVNARGVFVVSRAVVSRMIPRTAGAVVTIASNAANVPRTAMAAYAASKAAASMYTKCLGLEVARYGIRCNVVCPGSTDTPLLRSLWTGENGLESTLHGNAEEFRLGIPLGKIAKPVEVAALVAFLLSDEAGHITLQDITVDGGAALGA